MFNNISYRTVNILKYSAIGFVFAAISIVVVYFLSKQITEIAQNIHTYNNISAQKQERIDFSAQLSKDIEKIGAENEAQIQTALIIDENISDVVQIINTLAAKHSSTHTFPNLGSISSVAQSSGGNKSTVSSIDYSFQMTTNIASLINYLKEVEANKNFISTTSYNILGDEKTGWNSNANVNITGKIYYRTPNQ